MVMTIGGAILILVGLWDMFHSLLHPRGKGPLSHGVLSGVWAVSRSTRHRFGSAAGPGAMVAVTVLWVFLQIAGWALIYLPHVPEGFSYGPGMDPDRYSDVLEACYISMVALSTLGFGDVVPTQPVIRMLTPLQALTGFALLTGALSWFTQAFPPLSRRRALALDIAGMADVDYVAAMPNLAPTSIAGDLSMLASEVSKSVIDLVQHSESYYFREVETRTSLASQIPYLRRVQECAEGMDSTDVHLAARRLGTALDEIATELDGQFLRTGGSTDDVFRAYAHDHGR